MQLLLRVCSMDRVRTIQCSIQVTAARFWHQLHLSSNSRAADRCVSAFFTEFSSDWSSKADFSTLRWFMAVLSWAKHALSLNQKRFRQIDIEQHNSHTDPAQSTFEFISCNLILRLSCRLSNSSTKSSRSVFQLVLFNLK